MKKTAAQAAVERDRKFALPVAPNRLPDAPLPNDAPMSAPLPCWIRTSPIITRAARICSATIRFINRFMLGRLRLLFLSRDGARARRSGRCPADGSEVAGLQGGAADQPAVDVGLREQRAGVVGLDAAAVEDLHVAGVLGGGMQLGAQQRMHGLRFVRRR